MQREDEEEDLHFINDHLCSSALEAYRRRSERLAERLHAARLQASNYTAELLSEKAKAWQALEAKQKLERQLAEERRRTASRLWAKDCDLFFSRDKYIAFITPPEPAAVCKEVSCELRKKENGSIGTCRHEVKSVLQGSGNYIAAYLKKERLRWHPDKFAGKCDDDLRAEIMAKAAQMYAIFEELYCEASKSTGV